MSRAKCPTCPNKVQTTRGTCNDPLCYDIAGWRKQLVTTPAGAQFGLRTAIKQNLRTLKDRAAAEASKPGATRIPEATADTLRSLLMDLRGEARLYAKTDGEPWARTADRDLAAAKAREANALYDALAALNVRGLGSKVVLDG